MQQCGMWYKCKMIKMWIQILAQMASLFNSCTHANSSGAFFITLSFGYCTLCLDIEYACIDLVQVSGWVCIDFFGRGEGPQYIYLYTCKPGQPRDYLPHLISPPLQGSVKMPCLPQTIQKYFHDLGPLLAGSILVVEVYGRAADCEDFWVFLQQ